MDDNPFAQFAKTQKQAPTKKKKGGSSAQSSASQKETVEVAVSHGEAQSLVSDIRWRQAIALAVDDESGILKMHNIAIKANQQKVRLTQIRQLENLVHSVRSWSEILDFIYRQLSRHRDWQGWGEELEKELKNFKNKAEALAKEHVSQEMSEFEQRLKTQESILGLYKGMISHFSSRFQYENRR